jgi:hypothetical protein
MKTVFITLSLLLVAGVLLLCVNRKRTEFLKKLYNQQVSEANLSLKATSKIGTQEL